MRSLSTLLLTLCLSSVAAADDEGFIPLFDGKTLTGWRGDTTLWSVKDGAIFGKTDGNIPANTFLIHDGPYSDFILKVKFRLHNHKGNSGVQYRSEEIKETPKEKLPPFVIGGYQADIADDKHLGILYGERTGRGIIHDLSPEMQAKVGEAFHKDGWNEYTIIAHGDHITQILNGVTTVDIDDPQGAKSGNIALQLHRNHDMEVSFKDILIKPIKP
jgi:hypothetical protein